MKRATYLAAALVSLALGALWGSGSPVEAAPVQCQVFATDPNYAVSGQQNIPCGPHGLFVELASGTALSAGGTATALNPTYVEGTTGQPLSLDLEGGLRVVTRDSSGSEASGTFTNATQTTSVTSPSVDGYGTVTVSINGTYATASASFEQSDDGAVTYYPILCSQEGASSLDLGYTTLTNTSRMWRCGISGADHFRVRSTAVASGTVNVLISLSGMPTANGVTVGGVLAASSAVIGHVITDTGSTTAVTGNVTVVQGTGTNLHTVIDSGTTAVTNAGTFVTQENGAALTSLQLIDNMIAPITPATATATNTILLGSEYRSTLPTWTNAQQGAMQVGTRGSLDVTLFSQDTNVAAGYQANNADGIASSSTVNKLVVNSQSYILNGSGAFDRQVSVSNGMNIAATGIGAAGLAGQCDDTSPTSLTENSWGAVRESCTTHALYTERLPSGSAAVGLATVSSTALETGHVILASAGNLYGCDVVSTTVAGYVQVFNSTTVPAAGAVIPVDWAYVGVSGTVGIKWDPPLRLGTGISVAFSASTTPFTKTDSATAAISCQAN